MFTIQFHLDVPERVRSNTLSAFQTNRCWHFNTFPFSAISHWAPNEIKSNKKKMGRMRIAFSVRLFCVPQTEKETPFKRFITICWHTCRCGNPIETYTQWFIVKFIFVYIFSLRDLRTMCILFYCFALILWKWKKPKQNPNQKWNKRVNE